MSPEQQLDAAEKRLDRLLDWVSRSDTKFSVVLGVDTGMLGFLATSTPAGPVPLSALVFAALSVLLLAFSLFFVYRGTYPRTKGPGGSLVYFGSIAKKDREGVKDTFRSRTLEDHLDDMLDQVHRNSEIVDRKFAALRRSYRCLLTAVAPWAFTLFLFGLVPSPAA